MSIITKSLPNIARRRFMTAATLGVSGITLSGCNAFDRLMDRDDAVRNVLERANSLTYRMQRLLGGGHSMAKEFAESEIRQGQRSNGDTDPTDEDYVALKDNGFKDYKLEVAGLVNKPQAFSLADLKSMTSRTQITRHDCVEGWSCIAKWQGVPLQQILDQVGVKPEARYAMFHCFDAIEKGLSGEVLYYESIDLIDARHPQTILAYAMNDKPLPVENGAPLRVRVERQLGYKMAKYIRRIELISDFSQIEQGQGSYWADRGYEWYAGI